MDANRNPVLTARTYYVNAADSKLLSKIAKRRGVPASFLLRRIVREFIVKDEAERRLSASGRN